jgi:hypothetical protein
MNLYFKYFSSSNKSNGKVYRSIRCKSKYSLRSSWTKTMTCIVYERERIVVIPSSDSDVLGALKPRPPTIPIDPRYRAEKINRVRMACGESVASHPYPRTGTDSQLRSRTKLHFFNPPPPAQVVGEQKMHPISLPRVTLASHAKSCRFSIPKGLSPSPLLHVWSLE